MKKEKIIQISEGANGNPCLLTSLGRVLCVVCEPVKNYNGDTVNFVYGWRDITPKIEEVK